MLPSHPFISHPSVGSVANLPCGPYDIDSYPAQLTQRSTTATPSIDFSRPFFRPFFPQLATAAELNAHARTKQKHHQF
ncbi:hypothetical protein HYQ44_005377 [Verticillium longisporum]|nr:hypothetical protein HYQ44_005377 [Verticillium longisporum]